MTHAERLEDIGNRLAGSVMDPQARELYAIAAALEAERVVWDGAVTPNWGVDGDSLSEAIRSCAGQRVRVTVTP